MRGKPRVFKYKITSIAIERNAWFALRNAVGLRFVSVSILSEYLELLGFRLAIQYRERVPF